MFEGRKLLIATKHGKEDVIAPILEKELGVICFAASNLDTDQFGTFSGETERMNSPLITARQKCIAAMEIYNCDLVIANEGSFGPHPTLHFIPADDEIMLFIDKKNALEIVVREISTATNFNGALIRSEKELHDFSAQANFPSHGLIIKDAKDNFKKAIKGITSLEILDNTFRDYMSEFGQAYVETDMRAMINPMRMEVIKKASLTLVNKINTLCPNCTTPGFGITKAIQGLPCEICHFPTLSTLSYVCTCQKCKYVSEEKYPNGKITEEPMYCNYCNP